MNDKVSIIVPIYNAEKYLERCLESIRLQKYRNLEVVLIDDGSTDNSLSICQKYCANDERFILIHKENEGVSKARNVAFEKITGEYISFIDADDWACEDMIDEMVKSANENNADIVISEYNNFYESENRIEPIDLKEYDDKNFIDLICDETTQYGGFPWNKLIRKSIIKNKYHEDIHYYENFIFFLENGSKESKYSVVHKKLYNYCINKDSAVHSTKYNLKKLTTLTALDKILKLVPSQYCDYYKYIYICRAYENKYYLKKNNISNSKIDKFVEKAKEYYNDVMKSRRLNFGLKLKVYIHRYFSWIYKLYKMKEEK